jgi:hypothetical protein
MSFIEFASRMFPYWCLGGFMFWAVWNSEYKDLLAFSKKTYLEFLSFMIVVCVIRICLIRFIVHHGVNVSSFSAVKKLPIGGTLFVGWEDLAFSLPLVLLRRMLGTSKWMMPVHYLLLAFTTLAFFTGHIYQGYLSAGLISLYIPWAVNFSQKRGFRTLMFGHMTYDFLTFVALIYGLK